MAYTSWVFMFFFFFFFFFFFYLFLRFLFRVCTALQIILMSGKKELETWTRLSEYHTKPLW